MTRISWQRDDLAHNLGDVAVVLLLLCKTICSYLSNHAVPNAPDQFAVLAVGDQVEVVGKLNGAGQLLQDVYAEALTA